MNTPSNSTVVNIFCTGCRLYKPAEEFMDHGAKGDVKHYRTCKLCRNRTTQQKKTAKKRLLELEENEADNGIYCLEVLEANDLPEYLVQLLNSYRTQSEDNRSKFYFECALYISMYNKTAKKIADDLVESIEDVDEFAWMDVFFYVHC